MKKFLKIAGLILLGIIAIKLAVGLIALTIGLIIPLAILAIIGLVIWKLVDGDKILQKFTKKPSTIATPPLWQMDMDDDFTSYQQPEIKKNTKLKY